MPVPASPARLVRVAPPPLAAPQLVRPCRVPSLQVRPSLFDTVEARPPSTGALPLTSQRCSQRPRRQGCRLVEVDTGIPRDRSEPGATTAGPRATTSTRNRRPPVGHPRPSPGHRCTNEGWRSTSPAVAPRSDLATNAPVGCSRTANASDSRTGLRNPGTTARTATDPRGDPAFDAPPLHLWFFLADGHRAGRLATPPACSGTNDWRVVRMVWRGDDRP